MRAEDGYCCPPAPEPNTETPRVAMRGIRADFRATTYLSCPQKFSSGPAKVLVLTAVLRVPTQLLRKETEMKKFALIAALLARTAACGGVAFADDDQIGHCPTTIAARPVAVVSNAEKAPDFIDLASQTLKTMGDEHRQLTAAVKRLNDNAADVDGKLLKLYADAQGIAASLRPLHVGVSRNCYPLCVDGTSVANRCVAERLTSTLLARSRAIQGSIQVLEKQLSAGHLETSHLVGCIDTLESQGQRTLSPNTDKDLR